MKLSKLYCSDLKFKEIRFNEGINIIIGRIVNPENKDLNVHNLGKSLIVKIIDFMMLKSNDFLFKDIEAFKDYEFYLEIKLNSGEYLTIKRVVGNNRVCFKQHSEKWQDFRKTTEWDYKDYTTTSKIKDAKKLLQNYLNFDVLKDSSFRNIITYFLRGQSDYGDPFKLNKFKGKDSAWKPLLFEMLGYNGEKLNDKYRLDLEIEEIENFIKLEQRLHDVDINSIDEYRTQLETLTNNLSIYDAQIKKFDYYVSEQGITKELVDNVENKIAELNSIRYDLLSDTEKIKQSLEQIQEYDYQDLYSLFMEANIAFPDQIKKSYEDLINFNNLITLERRNKLHELLKKKEEYLIKVEKDLYLLNKSRVEILGSLSENDEFEKFVCKQKELIIIKGKIQELNDKVIAAEKILSKNEEKSNLITARDKVVKELEKEIIKGTDVSKNIKLKFSDYVNRLLSLRGVLSLKKNNNDNIDFKYSLMNSSGEITKESEGHTYLKAICSALDFAIVTQYSNKSFFRFVFHDGCVDGDDGRIAIKYLDLIKEISKDYGIQCIITMIDSVVPTKPDGTKYNISDNEVILELNDNPDNSGLLFGFKF